jgi:hypothetical protein
MSELRLNCTEGREPDLFSTHCSIPDAVHAILGSCLLTICLCLIISEIYVHSSSRPSFGEYDFEKQAIVVWKLLQLGGKSHVGPGRTFVKIAHFCFSSAFIQVGCVGYDREWDDEKIQAKIAWVVGCLASGSFFILSVYRSLRQGFHSAFESPPTEDRNDWSQYADYERKINGARTVHVMLYLLLVGRARWDAYLHNLFL